MNTFDQLKLLKTKCAGLDFKEGGQRGGGGGLHTPDPPPGTGKYCTEDVNPLSPNSFSTFEVMRIRDMITHGEFP